MKISGFEIITRGVGAAHDTAPDLRKRNAHGQAEDRMYAWPRPQNHGGICCVFVFVFVFVLVLALALVV